MNIVLIIFKMKSLLGSKLCHTFYNKQKQFCQYLLWGHLCTKYELNHNMQSSVISTKQFSHFTQTQN